jgi:nucleotide-binding universal stress UspA family protein
VTEILACIDGSAYGFSVCDHAAWLCGQSGGGSVTLLHVAEGEKDDGAVEGLLGTAQARLEDHGVADARAIRAAGSLQEALEAQRPDLIVLGKRGLGSSDARADLGANAAAVLRTCLQPLCLVSRVYLPIHRGLVLLDSDPGHRRTIESVARAAALRDLELDILMMQSPGPDGSRKLAWARESLGGGRADIYGIERDEPETVAAEYMAEHATDLIVFSREMMFAADRPTLPAEHRPVWSWRTPVFVC